MGEKGTGGGRQGGKGLSRDDRLAAALRENLKKRKDLVRKRADDRGGDDSPAGEPDNQD